MTGALLVGARAQAATPPAEASLDVRAGARALFVSATRERLRIELSSTLSARRDVRVRFVGCGARGCGVDGFGLVVDERDPSRRSISMPTPRAKGVATRRLRVDVRSAIDDRQLATMRLPRVGLGRWSVRAAPTDAVEPVRLHARTSPAGALAGVVRLRAAAATRASAVATSSCAVAPCPTASSDLSLTPRGADRIASFVLRPRGSRGPGVLRLELAAAGERFALVRLPRS